ncbi:MAG: hypothetical protein MZV64_30980 [Ignavibacteriales bacterium]|nr:hypothetical protein [Ignavibacteriales bacterium]
MSAQDYDEEQLVHWKNLIEKEGNVDGYKFLSEIFYVKGVESKNQYDNNKVLSDSLEAMKYFDKSINVAEEEEKIIRTILKFY